MLTCQIIVHNNIVLKRLKLGLHFVISSLLWVKYVISWAYGVFILVLVLIVHVKIEYVIWNKYGICPNELVFK